jgi:hypothetical protein
MPAGRSSPVGQASTTVANVNSTSPIAPITAAAARSMRGHPAFPHPPALRRQRYPA